MMNKKILIFNRRDIENPLSGGAEIYTHEIFKRLTDEFDITIFSSSFDGAKRHETIDQIKHIRYGGELTMHIYAFIYLITHFFKFDLIIDQFNGIGFSGFLFKKKSILLIHQLYDNFWIAKLGMLGHFFRFIEFHILPFYKKCTTVTVSNSTKNDLMKFGFKKNIDIVYNGINHKKYSEKIEFNNHIAYLGRMAKTKNPEDAIRAFLLVKKEIKDAILHIIGDGEERVPLKRKYAHINNIIFHGFVSEKEKYNILRNSSLLLVPSIREGWGQIVIQANMVGTPVIGYNVMGIKDSLKNNECGYLIKPGNFDEMAQKTIEILKNKKQLKILSNNSIKYSENFSWDKSAKDFKHIIKNKIKQL